MLNRANPKVKSPDEFYRVAIFLPFIDNIICDLANRFSKEVVEIFDLDLFLPNVIIKVFLDKYILGNKVQHIMDKFGEILIKHLSYSKDSINIKLAGEIELWHEFWINKNKIQSGEIPKTAIDLLEYCEELLYPCISILIQILSVLPASTSSAERCFSSLRRLKTWTRTRMGEDRLNGLALIHTHKDVEIDIEDVINIFAKSSRKLNFVL